MLCVPAFDKTNPDSKMNIYFTDENDFRSFLNMLWDSYKVSLDYCRIQTMMDGEVHTSGLERIVHLLKERYHGIRVYDNKYLFSTYLCMDEFPDLFWAFFDIAGAYRIMNGIAIGLGFEKVDCCKDG